MRVKPGEEKCKSKHDDLENYEPKGVIRLVDHDQGGDEVSQGNDGGRDISDDGTHLQNVAELGTRGLAQVPMPHLIEFPVIAAPFETPKRSPPRISSR
jgi:hypothetical protein